MRASRLVSVLLLLQTRGRMTAEQLAEELEVSVRTIYRDMDGLCAAGVPVQSETGRLGGYKLIDGYRTRLTGLTNEEAEALSLAGLPGPAADLRLGSVLAAAQLKLLAALPAELRDRAGRVSARFHLDAPGWYRDQEETPQLAAIAGAVWNEHTLAVRYHRWKAPEEVTRTLQPLGLVLKGGTWYLVARSAGRVNTYRVSQMRDVHPLEETFERPAGFDLGRYWQSYLLDFAARRRRGEAVIRVSPDGMRGLGDALGAEVARAAVATAGAPDARRWVRAVIPIESIVHAATELRRLGADVEVVEPPELRQRMAASASALARLYRAPRPGSRSQS